MAKEKAVVFICNRADQLYLRFFGDDSQYHVGVTAEVKDGESPAGAARRQLLEELCIDAAEGQLKALPAKGVNSHTVIPFKLVYDGVPNPQTAHAYAGWVTPYNIEEAATAGKLSQDVKAAYDRLKESG